MVHFLEIRNVQISWNLRVTKIARIKEFLAPSGGSSKPPRAVRPSSYGKL
jgi:hypothetical protein